MKIPIRGYLILDPASPYPNSSNFFIGGVAASAAHERANEEGGLVVELTGSYEKSDLEAILKDRIEDYEQMLTQAVSAKEKQRTQEVLDYYQEALKALESNDLQKYTNLAHFSKEEIEQLNQKPG